MPELAGQADSNRKFGVNPAFFGERGFTNASSSEVFAFFDRMLQQEGWTRDDSKVRGLTTWAEFHAYARGARAFAVAVVAADERARLSRMDARYATYRTVYETLIT